MLNPVAPKKKHTKMDMVHTIYDESSLKLSDVRFVVDRFINEMKYVISGGGSIELRGFGSFSVKIRKGRDNAHNPARPTEKVHTEDHGVAVFRPGKDLKQAVWHIKRS